MDNFQRNGLISVIMPCFNAAPFVFQAVSCVMNQTYANVELIVVDDGSDDGSIEILQQLAAQYPLRMTLLQQKHMGPYPARNRGLRHARGGAVAFLDADDYWKSDALERLAARLYASAADIAYCGWQNFGMTSLGTPFIPPDFAKMDVTAEFLRSCPWPIHAALVRREAIDAVHGFSEHRFSAMDYDLWLRLLAHTRKFVLVPEVLAFYRWHDMGQISNTKWKQVLDALAARENFIGRYPEQVAHLGKDTLYDFTFGALLREAYRAFWNRRLVDAQKLFRQVLYNGCWKSKDAKYILLALLPGSLLKLLLLVVDRSKPATREDDALGTYRNGRGKWQPLPDTAITGSAPAPVVSVIMPCLNSEKHIAAAIDSVLAQTFRDFELIIVDNGSTDRTFEILGSLKDPRIRILSQPLRGVSRARNLGLRESRGTFIAFLDSDDTWATDFLNEMYRALAANRLAVLAYCGWQNVGLPPPRNEPFIPMDYEGREKPALLLEGCRWPIHACLARRSAVFEAGGFDTSLTIGEDYLLWMEVSARGQILRVPKVLSYYYHHDGQQATSNRALAIMDTLKAKQIFLRRHPEIAEQIGPASVNALTWGVLIRQATAMYWRGDLENARPVLRKALLSGHGSLSAKLRMLPALLPISIHRYILLAKEKLDG
jgi:glycosyltransferase involved in cell wall biosynthesis